MAWLPPAPFSIVARAGAADHFAVFPLAPGEVLIAVATGDGGPSIARLVRLASDGLTLAPDLTRGLPPIAWSSEPSGLRAAALVSGRAKGSLWLAQGDPCVVREWQFPTEGWVVRPPSSPAPGRCKNLTAWTPGAALVAFYDEHLPTSLVAYGAAPRVIPRPAPGPRQAHARPCPPGPLDVSYYALQGFPTGEVVGVGLSLCGPETMIERWAKGASRSVTAVASMDPNFPFTARIPSPDDVIVEGDGSHPSMKGHDTQLAIHHRFAGGRFGSTASAIDVNALERWLSIAPQELFPAPEAGDEEGFSFDGFTLDEEGGVFVTGWLVRQGARREAVLLRDRPVAAPLSLSR